MSGDVVTRRYFEGSSTTSDDTRFTPRIASAISTDSTYAACDFVLPDSSTTPSFTDWTLMPLSSRTLWLFHAASRSFLISSSDLVSAAIAIWAKRFAPVDQRDDQPDRERHHEGIAQHQHRWGRY
jgi:hypothetical protein